MTSTTVIGVMLSCAAVTVATAIGWLLTLIATRRCRDSWPAEPRARARHIAFVRLLPLLSVAVVVPAQVIAFARHEAGGTEFAGVLLAGLAGGGILLLSDAVRLALIASRRTGDIIRDWKSGAEAMAVSHWQGVAWSIRGAVPVVAVAGVVRPQLFIDRQVIDRCTPAELAAIAAHESAHVAAADNLIRWLFRVTPGASLFARVAQPLEASWAAASEQAADVYASYLTSPVELASALTKVARLTPDRTPDLALASALIGENTLHERVERLLTSAGGRPPRPRWLPCVGTVLALFAFLQSSVVSRGIHQLFELLVRHQ